MQPGVATKPRAHGRKTDRHEKIEEKTSRLQMLRILR
jgi:hypothetical protein